MSFRSIITAQTILVLNGNVWKYVQRESDSQEMCRQKYNILCRYHTSHILFHLHSIVSSHSKGMSVCHKKWNLNILTFLLNVLTLLIDAWMLCTEWMIGWLAKDPLAQECFAAVCARTSCHRCGCRRFLFLCRFQSKSIWWMVDVRLKQNILLFESVYHYTITCFAVVNAFAICENKRAHMCVCNENWFLFASFAIINNFCVFSFRLAYGLGAYAQPNQTQTHTTMHLWPKFAYAADGWLAGWLDGIQRPATEYARRGEEDREREKYENKWVVNALCILLSVYWHLWCEKIQYTGSASSSVPRVNERKRSLKL